LKQRQNHAHNFHESRNFREFAEQISTESYARGPATPLLELTIGDLLERTADRFPDRLAVASRHQEKRLTWAELSAAADRVARGLWALGIRRGDRVACGRPTASSG